MRKDSDGRDTVPLWSVAQRVYGAIDSCPGTVVSVDDRFDTFIVKWEGNDFPVVYPRETIMIRRGFPWET